jgi:hypothetical protein
MKSIKRKLFLILIIIFFYLFGIITMQLKIFPYYILKDIKNEIYINFFFDDTFKKYQDEYPEWNHKEIFFSKYLLKQNIWIDRIFYNQKNEEKLRDYYIIQLERHRNKNLKITFLEDVTIYRPICKLNNNSKYKNWELDNFELLIIGSSCVHSQVYKKKYTKGTYFFSSGGPISSDPILISGISKIDSVIIHDK